MSLRRVRDEQPAEVTHALSEQFGEPVVAGAHGWDRERAVVADRKDDRRHGIVDDGDLDRQLPNLVAAEGDCPGEGSAGGGAVSRGRVFGADDRAVRPPPTGSRRLDVRRQPGRRTPARDVVDRREIAGQGDPYRKVDRLTGVRHHRDHLAYGPAGHRPIPFDEHGRIGALIAQVPPDCHEPGVRRAREVPLQWQRLEPVDRDHQFGEDPPVPGVPTGRGAADLAVAWRQRKNRRLHRHHRAVQIGLLPYA